MVLILGMWMCHKEIIKKRKQEEEFGLGRKEHFWDLLTLRGLGWEKLLSDSGDSSSWRYRFGAGVVVVIVTKHEAKEVEVFMLGDSRPSK